MEQSKVVVITGGSAGLGFAIADIFAAKGWITYTLSRRENPPEASSDIIHIKADVTQPATLERAFHKIVEKHGHIDAVICNAGMNINGVTEELSIDQAKLIMDTNFYGMVYTIGAALPILREQRQGEILVVGSLAGTVSVPGESYYSASKHAVRGFLESLLLEVDRFGIGVHVIEPGFIKTDLAKNPIKQAFTINDYNTVRENLARHWSRSIDNGISPSRVAQRIFQVVNGRSKRFRIKVGMDGFWVPIIKPLVPEKLYYAIIKRVFGLR